MNPLNTKHASEQAQNRGIPPGAIEMLDRYGVDEYDGHGCLTRYISKESLRQMERDWGRPWVSQFEPWLNVYKVCSADGQTITIGHRFRRIRRK